MKRRVSRTQLRMLPLESDAGIIVDLFAGGGGASTGIEAALGVSVDVALNHDPIAMAVHTRNHPETMHLTKSVWRAKPREVTGGRRVRLLWASPDCTHFSNAKGDVPKSKKIRALANVVVRWAKDVRPAVIFTENVREFLGWGPLDKRTKKPIPAKKGVHFRRWVRGLENLGYAVEWRVLDASQYGAPTRRRRLFIIARCDGQPIVWPAPTHGPGLLPLRTAAECIDWSIPCPSIFGRKKPLAEKTMWRIAQGLRRFVFENPRPFILKVNHGKREDRSADIFEPLSTVTATQRGHAVVVPTLIQSGYGERPGQTARVPGLDVPLGTVVAGGPKHALVAAWLAKHYGDPKRKRGGGVVVGSSIEEPVATVTARDHHSVVSAVLVEPGQRHGRGQKGADEPLSTIVAKDRHALAAVALATFRGTDPSQPGSAPVDAPMPTVSAGGIHVGEVRAFLTAYYGSDGSKGQRLDEPSRTITSKPRLGLVTVEGTDYQIVDICFRMLEPEPELKRAQFGRFAGAYDMRDAKTKASKVKLLGNSVPPEMAEALVAANVSRRPARKAA